MPGVLVPVPDLVDLDNDKVVRHVGVSGTAVDELAEMVASAIAKSIGVVRRRSVRDGVGGAGVDGTQLLGLLV